MKNSAKPTKFEIQIQKDFIKRGIRPMKGARDYNSAARRAAQVELKVAGCKKQIVAKFQNLGWLGSQYFSAIESAALEELKAEGKAQIKVINGLVCFKVI